MMDEFEDFKGPPSLTRVILGSESSDSCPFSGGPSGFSSRDSSLASLTGEVVEAQKYQVTELSNKKTFLEQLKIEYNICKSVQDDVQNELIALNRQLYIIQDDVTKSDKSCNQFRSEIKKSLEEKRERMSELINMTWKRKGNEESFQKYKSKMNNFESRMKDYLKESELSKELDKLKEIARKNRSKLDSLLSEEDEIVNKCDSLETKLNDNADEITNLNLAMKDLECRIKKKKEHKIILEKEIDALYKRNAGQLTRLKHQLKESQTHASRWHDDNIKLEERIHQLKAQSGFSS